jgi:hypothetical protein
VKWNQEPAAPAIRKATIVARREVREAGLFVVRFHIRTGMATPTRMKGLHSRTPPK